MNAKVWLQHGIYEVKELLAACDLKTRKITFGVFDN